MSGGSFNYMCYKVLETYEGRMLDPVLDRMLEDFVKVLHDLEWYDSADYSEEHYRRTVEWFKTKWIGKPTPILRDVVEQEMQNMRRRLLTAVAWEVDGDG